MGEDEKDKGGKASPDVGVVIGAYVAVAVGIGLAIWLTSKNDVTIGVTEGFAPFAVIYIVAQAIERLIQPLTGFTGKAKEKQQTKAALSNAKKGHAEALVARNIDAAKEKATKVADEQDRLQVIEADRAVAFWAVATFLALLAAGALELGLIQSIADVSGTDGEVPGWFTKLDVVITGIAIGAGTKPLHDLISFIQSAKQKGESKAPAAPVV